MKKNQIREKFYEAVKKRDIPMTQVRDEIGIAYPTLLRFLSDQKTYLTTLLKIEKWADRILEKK